METATIIIGIIGATASVVAFLPQAWRIIKTRKTEDLSTPMWTLQVFAFISWVVYGVCLGAWPIIVPNSICCLLAMFILTMKLLPSHARDQVADSVDPSK